MLKPPISGSSNNNNSKISGHLDDLNEKGAMSGQPYSSWHAQTSSTSSVTGTSELFGSTYAMLSDHATYPDQWPGKQVTQSILFEQPQIQPLVGNSYDPPVRFDPPYAYRSATTGYMSAVPALSAAAAQYYPPRTNGYSSGSQFYSPTLSGVPNTQQLLLAAQAAQVSSAQQLQQNVLRPEPLRPATQKVGNGINRSTSNSSAETMRNNSVSVATVSPSDDNSLNSPALTSSGSAASGTPPLGSDNNNTDLESTDEERVMCMACRGVYPSRRSLTGHIGRNEKCREIIGRNYLDALASGINPPIPGTDAAIKSGAITTGADGMSPVCPYCDRFISHYKGNIRRHINQCSKSAEPIKRHRIDHKEKHPKKRIKKEETSTSYHHDYIDHDSSSLSGGIMNSPKMSSPSSSFYAANNSSDLCSPNEYSNGAYEHYSSSMNGHSDRTPPEAAVLQDAYICEDCDFVTVYKGNMKRHLNTCHPHPECKSLKVTEWDHKLEGMRASNLGISGDRLQERLAAHKANSSRGRKPRKKKENNTSEESEPMDYKAHLNPETGNLLDPGAPTSSLTLEGFSNGNNFQPPPPPPPSSSMLL